MAPAAENMTDLQKEVFTKINNNEAAELKVLLAANKIKVDFVDENGMSPLQHASYKGNKEIVQMLLDQVNPSISVLVGVDVYRLYINVNAYSLCFLSCENFPPNPDRGDILD